MSLKHKLSSRIPVVYQGKPYSPIRTLRAKRLVKLGKAKFCTTKDLLPYLKLKYKPSGENLVDITVGIDPGSSYDGITVLSKYCHHLNIELIHTTDIKKRMKNRSFYRRMRRSRLWHRPIRFSNRTKKKIPPTIKSKIQFKIYILSELMKLYPINTVIIENVSFNHYKYDFGRYFSLVEVGKTYLYDTIKSLGLKLILKTGVDTYDGRKYLFGSEVKVKDKSKLSFYSHCIDSFTLCYYDGIERDLSLKLNLKVYYIQRNFISRRELHHLRNKYKDKKYFFTYSKDGKIKVFKKYNKPKKIRVKVTDSTKSNHGPWIYKYQEILESFHSFRSNYGGTIIKGGWQWKKQDIGKSKRLIEGNENGYLNRLISIQYG